MRTPGNNPPSGTPYLGHFRAPTTGVLGVTLVSPKLEQWDTHHLNNRDRPCGRELGQTCPHCAAGRNPRPVIYALAVEFAGKKLGIVNFTTGALEHCEQLRQLAGDCRGVSIRLSRLRSARTSPIRIEVMEKRVPSGQLPVAGDILRRGLARLWEMTPEQTAWMLAAVDEAELPDVTDLGAAQVAAELPAAELTSAAEASADPPTAVNPVMRVTSRSRPGFVRWAIDKDGTYRVAELGGACAEFPELVRAAGLPVELPDVAAQVAAQVADAERTIKQAAADPAAADLGEMRRMLHAFANGTTMPRPPSADN